MHHILALANAPLLLSKTCTVSFLVSDCGVGCTGFFVGFVGFVGQQTIGMKCR